MKKFWAIVLAVVLVLSLTACVSTSGSSLGSSGLISVPEHRNLWYDPDTKVVYIMFSDYTYDRGFGYMSPYYAPNGLPYLYDTETQALVEIQPN